MTGLIQMEEYLKVVRERDELAEELAASKPTDDDFEVEMHSRLGLTGALTKCLAALYRSYPRTLSVNFLNEAMHSRSDENNVRVRIFHLRRRLERAGAVGKILVTYETGYRIDADLHQWISAALGSDERKRARG